MIKFFEFLGEIFGTACGMVGLYFLSLKISGSVSWSWLFVLSPFILSFITILFLLFWGYIKTKINKEKKT